MLSGPTTNRRVRRPTKQGRGVRLWAWLLLLLAAATGCQADFAVEIQVEEDGSGIVMTEVVLDQEAGDALLDLGPGQTLPLADLALAGWTIGPPDRAASGDTTITASKAFGTPSQLTEVISELTQDKILRNFTLTRDPSFGRVDYAVTGVIDTTEGLAAFTDAELDDALGTPLATLIGDAPYNATPGDINITVAVMMPGELQEDGSTATVQPAQLRPRGVWDANLASDQTVDLALRTARRSTSAQVLRGVAVVAGFLAALVAFAQLLRVASGLRRRKPAAKVRPADARGRSAAEVTQDLMLVAAEEEQEETAEVDYKVVALDGMGVLYREGNDVKELLIPFARQQGSTVSDEDIVVKARQLSLGRMTPADFWKVIDVEGDPNRLDADYLASHQLMPGVVKYLRSLRDNGVQAACITNDAAAWAMKLRAGHSLEGLIDPWVISGSVGVRKPDGPLYEVLRRVTGEPPASILVIDDDLDNLDAARELGFGTAWFSADGERADARDHDVFRSFDALTPDAGEADGNPSD